MSSTRWIALALLASLTACGVPEAELQEGPVARAYADGSRWVEGQLIAGLPAGTWRTWYPDGQPKSVDTYLDGRLEGPSSAWFADGRPRFEGAYEAARPTGFWKRWYKSGQPLSEGRYQAGVRLGAWTNWYPWGTVQIEADYTGSGGDGSFTHFYEDGQEKSRGAVVDGLRDGEWTEWYEDGTRSKLLTFRAGKLEGDCAFYGPDGSLDQERSGTYANGKLTGR